MKTSPWRLLRIYLEGVLSPRWGGGGGREEVQAAPPRVGKAGVCSLTGHTRDPRPPDVSATRILTAFPFLNVANMTFTVMWMPVWKQ